MSEHTPGPWKYYVQRTCDGYETHIIETEAKVCPYEGNSVCSCGGMKEGDGHLIAAAPELLEALEDLLSICETDCDEPEECEWARAAIAKAKGEQE